MWNPPIALSPEEQKIVARTQKARKFFVFLRTIRHELLDADFQQTLAKSYSPEPGGKAPVDAGVLALATLLQAYCHVSDQDAVELTVMDKRWQMVLDCLGAEHPPFSRGTLFHFRLRLIAHNLDKTLLDRTVALAEQTGGFGARQLRAALDSTPLVGAGRVEDTLNLLAMRCGRRWASRPRRWTRPPRCSWSTRAWSWSGKAVSKPHWISIGGTHGTGQRAPPSPGGGGAVEKLARAAATPCGAGVAHPGCAGDHRADCRAGYRARPGGGPGARRIKQHVAPDRRISIEDADMRHGRKSSSKTFNGFKEHMALDLDSKVTREVVVCPANQPEHEAVELLAEELEKGPGLFQLDIDLGYMASPRMAHWAAQGVHIIARPWPQSGPLFTKDDFTLDFPHGTVTCPNGQTVPMVPARMPSFRLVPAMPVRCGRSVPPPGSGTAGA